MKRHAFILTEILTGMMLQVMFAVVLCSAFYMILNFSTNAQQGFAANDKGQVVISYFDSRIRNAGLGLWGCPSSKDIRLALNSIPALQQDNATNQNATNQKNLCLPVAIVRSDDKGHGIVSHDKKGRFYRGNVVTLLYARKDPNEVRLILLTSKDQMPRTVTSTSPSSRESNKFDLIDNNGTNNINSYLNSEFNEGNEKQTNIKRYAVMESSGIPVHTQVITSPQKKVGLRAPSASGLDSVTVYPMSEMLNLVCQKLYVRKDSNGYNFVFHELNDSGKWGKFYYHTKDILDLYMTLDTKPNTPDRVPIFELRVLVSEGINELGTTSKPKDWPGRWTTEFSTHKVHVSKATWKLYNLVPQFAD